MTDALSNLTLLQRQHRRNTRNPARASTRERRTLLRTGCIPCLRAGIRCDRTRDTCEHDTVSENWKFNRSVNEPGLGTWRERRGLHSFVYFALAPERSGYFRSAFWHDTVVTACVQNEALFCISSAVGALYEHVLKKGGDGSSLTFALQQCNRSITLLTSPNGARGDPEVAIVACILFVCFESLQGNNQDAINHCLQGSKLLAHLTDLTVTGRKIRLIDPMVVRPIIKGLDVQASCIPGSPSLIIDPLVKMQELCLPNFVRIFSLEHAHFLLHSVYTILLDAGMGIKKDLLPYDITILVAERYHKFVPWLEHWNREFEKFLAQEGDGPTARDRQRIKILQVNLKTMMLLATVDLTRGTEPWDAGGSTATFEEITDLAASVLRTHSIGSFVPLGKASAQFPFSSMGLWVVHPLFCVFCRCPDPEIKRRAIQLLLAQPHIARTNEPIHDTTSVSQAWTTDEWINFAASNSIEDTAGILLGGFDRPS